MWWLQTCGPFPLHKLCNEPASLLTPWPVGYPCGWVVTMLARWAVGWKLPVFETQWGCWCQDATVVIVTVWLMICYEIFAVSTNYLLLYCSICRLDVYQRNQQQLLFVQNKKINHSLIPPTLEDQQYQRPVIQLLIIKPLRQNQVKA